MADCTGYRYGSRLVSRVKEIFLLRSLVKKTCVLAAVSTLLSVAPGIAATLSNNLSSASGGTEAASGSDLLAASFTTDASVYSLEGVTLGLADLTASGGTATVSLYSDDGLNEPGLLVASLAGSSSFGATLTNSLFGASGLGLSANSTYWIVLTALSGEIDWSYAADDNGAGVGFTDTWAASYDGGASWFAYSSNQGAGVDPLQLDVEASAVPEPSFAMPCIGLLFCGIVAAKKGAVAHE
jgi:hypothetical protein